MPDKHRGSPNWLLYLPVVWLTELPKFPDSALPHVSVRGPLCASSCAGDLQVVFLASKLATFSGKIGGGMYGYRLSKLAVRGAAAALAQDLKPCGVSVITLHPGAVSLTQLHFRIVVVV